MSKNSPKICDHCGAKIVEYRHRLSPPLVESLRKLEAAGGGPINLKELDLTYNARCNFQKLRYWDLVKQVRNADGSYVGGVWAITMRGRAFLSGSATAFPQVWTYRGTRVRYEGVPIRITDVMGPHYQHRPEWAAQARAHAQKGS